MKQGQTDIILSRLMALHPKIIDLSLDRVLALLDRLGNPHHTLPPVIHIAGTNGKGSTLAFLRAGLEAAGNRVHAYTSPHLVRFAERIRIDGQLISDAALQAVLNECEQANAGAPITYFEITTCAALLAFSRCPADYVLLEVGLGGRLDATNVIDEPTAVMIAPISLDHQQYLGDTLAEIAFEKAGILKRNTFCVVAPQEDAAMEVIEKCARESYATLQVYGQHWHAWEENNRLIFQDENGLLDLPMPRLAGAHQVLNAGAALAMMRLLHVREEAAYQGAVQNVEWPGRLQKLTEGAFAGLDAEVWLDGGHNPSAAVALGESLSALPDRPLYLIVGMLKTKDVAGYFTALAPMVKGVYSVSIPGEDATLSADETAEAARGVGLSAVAAADVQGAIDDIIAVDAHARIVICGSLYLAGAVLRMNDEL